MAKCDICGKKVPTAFKCKDCGSSFCEKCGSKDKLICEDCLEYENQSQESYKLEQETEMDTEDY